jgi:hypothetical protein
MVRVRRAAVGTVSVLVLFASLTSSSAPAAGARHKARPKCPYSAAESVIANSQAEVYGAPGRGTYEGLDEAFGCAYAQGRSYRLSTIEECLGSSSGGCGVSFELEILAGSVVAYTAEAKGPQRYGVFVRNLRNGRLLHVATSATGPVEDLVVKSDGAVAWVVQKRPRPENLSGPPAESEIYAFDKSGKRLLASGTEIAPNSLALAGSTLYWTQGGKAFSAPLK